MIRAACRQSSFLLSSSPSLPFLAAGKFATLLNLKQVRTTVIVEVTDAPDVERPGKLPVLPVDTTVYRNITPDNVADLPDITCILTDHVAEVGVRGQMVTIKRNMFREVLQPMGLAVYASSESLERFAAEREARGDLAVEEEKLGKYGEMTVKYLSRLHLRVHMSGDSGWVLDSRHVRVALRLAGVEADEEAIVLPQEPITLPGPFKYCITVNRVRSVDLQGYVLLRHNDPRKDEVVDLPPMWMEESQEDMDKQPWRKYLQ